MAIIKDATLEVDEFAKNEVLKGVEAEAQQLYNLLYMEPGDCADDPERGIGVRKYRVGISDDTAVSLKAEIMDQVDKYCDFQISDIAITYENGELAIGVQTPSSNDIIVFQTTSDNILTNIINS